MATYTESFNTANSTTLGPDLSWTENVGSMEIVGNAARASVTGTECYASNSSQTEQYHKRAKITVKTFVTPSSGKNTVFVLWSNQPSNYRGAYISVDSAGVCTARFMYSNAASMPSTWSDLGSLATITKPTVPFTLEVTHGPTAGGPVMLFVNGVKVADNGGSTFGSGTGGGIGVFAQNNIAEVEIDSFETTTDNVLPTTIPGFNWPQDGIAYAGPFISSAGSVYVVAGNASYAQPVVYKATDPTSSFGLQAILSGAWSRSSVAVQQVGDVLHIFGGGTTAVHYNTWNMATDTSGTLIAVNTGLTAVNTGCVGVRRSNGDVIVFYNHTGVVNMGKTYGRVGAVRIAGGTTVDTTKPTAIGFTPADTTQQPESIDSAVLGASDRIHLFWIRGSATAAQGGSKYIRTVKSTDNLNGTVPATAATSYTIGTATPGVAVDDVRHESGQPFYNATSGKVSVFTVGGSINPWNYVYCAVGTGISADSLQMGPGGLGNFSSNATVTPLPEIAAFGLTDVCARLGGSPFDGNDLYVTWVDQSGDDVYYNKSTDDGVTLGTATQIANTTSTHISSNIFTRGTNVVLAMVYDVSAGVWVYDEVFLRTTGPPTQTTSISPAIFTLTSVALTGASGPPAYTLTPATFTLTPVALTRSVGGVTASISPVIITLTPVALVRGTDTVTRSITSVTFTLIAVAIVRGTDTSTRPITSVIFTLTPIALTRSVGDATISISPATFTLAAVPLTASSVTEPQSTSIAPAIFTLTPVALAGSVGDANRTITPVTFTLTPITLTRSVGDANRTVTPAIFTLTPIVLTQSVGATSTSIISATFTLTPVALVRSIGTTTGSITSAIFTLTSVALTTSVGGTAASSISPSIFTLTPVAISGFAATPGTGNIVPVTFTLLPVALTKSVGPVLTSITRATFTLTPVALVRGTDTVSRTITPTIFTFAAVALARGTDTVSRTLTPTQFVLTPVALTRSVGGTASCSLIPTTFTLTPVALTRSIGTTTYSLVPITITLTPVTLTYSTGATTSSINPAIFTLLAVQISLSGFGGRPYVWMGTEWVDKPVKRWTGTVWVEEPMKVWTGSSWKLV